MPPPGAADELSGAGLAAPGRWAVAALALVVGGGAGILAMTSRSYLPGGGGAGGQLATSPAGGEFPSDQEIARHWPRFRGPGGLGVSPYANLPVAWSAKTLKGIAWKTQIPLPGKNSPIVWGDRVFLTGATKEKREVYCLEAGSGRLLWRHELAVAPPLTPPPEPVMEDTGYAAPTAVTDGRRVYAIFASGELICLDFAGRKVWGLFLGTPKNDYGHASSLEMYHDRLLVQLDQATDEDGMSVLLALEGSSGREIWRARRKVGGSWASPIVIHTPGGDQIITCANPFVIAYDPAGGQELWRAECLEGDGAPSPVYANGLVLAGNVSSRMAAIRPDGRGDVTKTHIVWSVEDNLPDICTPLSDGRSLFLVTSDGLLTCWDLKDGRNVWKHDFEAAFIASPSLAGNRLYVLGRKGVMHVVETLKEFKLIGTADVGEQCEASPAFADGRIFIRGKTHLFCIQK